MTTQEQIMTEQQRGQGGAPVSGGRGTPAGADQTDASQHQPILRNSQAIYRAAMVVVKKRMGKQHWATQWVLILCKVDPQFMIHFAEQPRGYAHFLCLIRMALVAQGANDGSARDQARMLRTNSKKALLNKLFPSCPPGTVNLLHKLPKKPLPEVAYRNLICTLEDERARKRLYHMERIKKSDIFMLNMAADFPGKFRSVAMRCVKDIDDYERFWWAIQLIKKFNLKVTEQELALGFRQGINFRDVDSCANHWLVRKISKLPFPAPPWDGDGDMLPICSLAELKRAAEKLENCLTCRKRQRCYAFRIVTGYHYLYVCDRMPAMTEVVRDGLGGWSIREIGGKGDKRITIEQEYEVRRKFSGAGIAPIGISPLWR